VIFTIKIFEILDITNNSRLSDACKEQWRETERNGRN